LRWYQNKNIYPTLRQIDYRLISFNMFPGLKKSYTKLSEALTHEKQHGNIDWGVIKDEQRITKDVYPDYYTPKDYLEYKLDNLKNVSDDYDIPKWYMQPNYVEIWIEKGADVDTFKTLSEDWQVNIRQNKGFEGWEAAFQNFKKIVRTMYIENMQKKVYIFYFGDMDPSGDIMEDHLRTQARHFSDYDFGFDKYYFGYGHRRKNYTLGYVSIKRLGVTQDQISKYDIPLDIDSAVMDKLFGTSIANGDAKDKKGDSRTSGFIEKYKEYIKPGDKLPPMAEMDALVTTDELLNEIKRLITNNISPLFNKPIYRNEVELKLEPERERIRKMLNKRIKFTD
jgi:hypothetical protein